MFSVSIERLEVFQIRNRSVDTQLFEAVFDCPRCKRLVVPFPVSDKRSRKKQQVFFLSVFQNDGNTLRNLFPRPRNERRSRARIVHDSDSGEKQSQILCHFRNGRDSGFRTPPCDALLNSDGRRQAFQYVRVRAGHLFDKLTSVSAHAFHKTPLPFRKNYIERERGFPGTGNTRKHGECAMGNFQRDVFQIVFAHAAKNDSGTLSVPVVTGARLFAEASVGG